jgi:GDPmannose 4,6-dehydratase
MLQQETPDDYVVGTGESHSVKEFLEEAFVYAGLDWQKYVRIDTRYLRPTELDSLLAGTGKAKKHLGWEPKVKFKELVRIMVDADMEAVGIKCPGDGKTILSRYCLNTVDRALLSQTLGDD